MSVKFDIKRLLFNKTIIFSLTGIRCMAGFTHRWRVFFYCFFAKSPYISVHLIPFETVCFHPK